jgi:hypothetical protein
MTQPSQRKSQFIPNYPRQSQVLFSPSPSTVILVCYIVTIVSSTVPSNVSSPIPSKLSSTVKKMFPHQPNSVSSTVSTNLGSRSKY